MKNQTTALNRETPQPGKSLRETFRGIPGVITPDPRFSQGRDVGPQNPGLAPQPPSMSDRTQEMLNHIANLEREHAILRGTLFGEGECGPAKETIPCGLDGMLADACTRIACMVGDMATINGKVAR